MCLVAQSCPTLCDLMDCSLSGSSVHWDSPGKNTGVGCHALLQGIFPTQGSNQGVLHCRRILYHLSHQRSPNQLCSSLYHIFVAVLEKCQRRVSGTSAAAAFKKLYLGASSLHLVEILDSWITGNIQLSLNLKKKKKKHPLFTPLLLLLI